MRMKETSSFSITSTDNFKILSYSLNGCTVSTSGNTYTFSITGERSATISGTSYNYAAGAPASVTLVVQLTTSS